MKSNLVSVEKASSTEGKAFLPGTPMTSLAGPAAGFVFTISSRIDNEAGAGLVTGGLGCLCSPSCTANTPEGHISIVKKQGLCGLPPQGIHSRLESGCSTHKCLGGIDFADLIFLLGLSGLATNEQNLHL